MPPTEQHIENDGETEATHQRAGVSDAADHLAVSEGGELLREGALRGILRGR